MDLPFKVQPKVESLAVGSESVGILEMPKLYGVTPAEELRLIDLLRSHEATPESLSLNVAVATVALQRICPEQSESETRALPLALIEALSEYLFNERAGWKTPDPIAEDDPEKKSTGTTTKRPSKKASAKPSGDSKDGSPMTPDSAPSDSPTNPSP